MKLNIVVEKLAIKQPIVAHWCYFTLRFLGVEMHRIGVETGPNSVFTVQPRFNSATSPVMKAQAGFRQKFDETISISSETITCETVVVEVALYTSKLVRDAPDVGEMRCVATQCLKLIPDQVTSHAARISFAETGFGILSLNIMRSECNETPKQLETQYYQTDFDSQSCVLSQYEIDRFVESHRETPAIRFAHLVNRQVTSQARLIKIMATNEFKLSQEKTFESFEQQREIQRMKLKRLSNTNKSHLIVFVHGFHGCYLDGRCLLEFLRLIPGLMFIMLDYSTENDTSIFRLAKVLKKNLDQQISKLCGKEDLPPISFIGFSQGGLIVEAMLSEAQQDDYLIQNLHKLFFFNCPLLGTSNTNVLVRMGMKLLLALHRDSPQYNCLLDVQNKDEVLDFLGYSSKLKYCEQLVLIGTVADGITSLESALGVATNESEKNAELALLGVNVERYALWVDEALVDDVAGAKAHIQGLIDIEAVALVGSLIGRRVVE